jgi:hypothetical protein
MEDSLGLDGFFRSMNLSSVVQAVELAIYIGSHHAEPMLTWPDLAVSRA